MLELKLAEYLLNHAEGLQQWLSLFAVAPAGLFLDEFEDQACRVLSHRISRALGEPFDEVWSIMTPEFVKRYAGGDFFSKIVAPFPDRGTVS